LRAVAVAVAEVFWVAELQVWQVKIGSKSCFVDLIKTCLILLNFYSTNSINFNAEFPTLMRFYLLQGGII
jgi:hypothetical protein